jgi:putative ABC transport system substrate-binding protein
MMRRREFVTLLGGAAAWSIASNAQPTERTRVVGVLEILGPDDPETKTRSEVFAQTLQQLGWAVGRDLKIETRNVGGDRDHLRRYAAELIALTPDVIVSVGSVTVCAAATSHSHHPDCIRECPRSDWCRLRTEHGPPRRQYHRLLEFRIQHEWKMG